MGVETVFQGGDGLGSEKISGDYLMARCVRALKPPAKRWLNVMQARVAMLDVLLKRGRRGDLGGMWF
jgi:hypothetical protein